ncbi:tetratricopeptide repeat protein [Shewanella indica]|uniref:transglutaminase family protein n=1 Tax=Shewanella indica TaxID=768528 RepID=UPI0039998C0A
MQQYSLKQDELSLPESAFELCQHLGFGLAKQANWAWLELSGSVLSHYLVDQQRRFQALLDWFYKDLGFGPREDYFSRQAADLGQCILNRQGNSTTLATVLMLLGKQLDLKFDPVLLPGTTVLACHVAGELIYLDPLRGERLSKERLHALVRGELGNSAPLKASYLKPVGTQRLMTRMLHELKAGAIVAHEFEVAMECCNLLLEWHADDLSLHRERAFIAQQLGAIHVASADLQYFVDNSPHDPVVELVKMQLRELGDDPQTFH